jgi:tetrapyrrole methylase family protein/MazG family protein
MRQKRSSSITKAEHLFGELITIMAKLRSPDGCPWDKHQTHTSLLPYLFSEAAEVRQAVKKRDWKNLEEELGDVLLQIVFHSQVASENGRFDIAGVVEGINRKLIRRHPHVFGDKKLSTPEEVRDLWETIKKQEKKEQAARRPRQKPKK